MTVRALTTFYFIRGITMSEFAKDVLTGLGFVLALCGLISGEIIVSSVLFATAAIATKVNVSNKEDGITEKLTCE